MLHSARLEMDDQGSGYLNVLSHRVLRDFFSMGSVFSVAKKVFTHTFRHSHDQQDITLHAEGSTIQVLRV